MTPLDGPAPNLNHRRPDGRFGTPFSPLPASVIPQDLQTKRRALVVQYVGTGIQRMRGVLWHV